MPGRVAARRLGGIPIGRIDGVPVELHPGFFVTAAVLSFYYWGSFRLCDVELGLALVSVLLGSVLVHELGHAVAARHFKIRTRLIEINMSGGLAHLEGAGWRMRDNCLILLAGPLANLAFAVVAFAAFLSLWSDPYVFVTASDWGELIPDQQLSVVVELYVVRVLRLVVFVNLGLCFVNLLPGFPLDGGRILFLLLAWRWRVRTATFVVGLVGMVLSVLSLVFLVATMLSGFAILAPPWFGPNWHAVRNPGRAHPFG